MSFTMKWYCKGLVIYAHLGKVLTTEDLRAFSMMLQTMVEESDAPMVHLISNISQLESYPSLTETMRGLKMPSRLGWSISMGSKNSRILRFIAQAVSSAMRLSYREVDTFDEALQFLQQRDIMLPNLTLYRHIAEHDSSHVS